MREEPPIIDLDGDSESADWTKRTWDLPPYKSADFFTIISVDQLDMFRRLPVYRFAVEKGLIHDDEWVADWVTLNMYDDRSSRYAHGPSMTVPTYDKFIEPILRFLAARPAGVAARDAHEAAAQALGLSDTDRQELLPSGAQPIYKNRAGWAHDRLKRAGLSSSPRRGFWKLTDEGIAFAASHAAPLSAGDVEQLAIGFMDVMLRPPPSGESLASPSLIHAPSSESAIASPDDRLGQAVSELRRSVAAELLESLATVSPSFFEAIVLDLLHRMGYGASRADLQRVGGTGDGGIDGVISLDKLGLEKVYVQAKRWQSTVGRPEIQGFYGALAGQRANKGVFITTSGYTAQAIEFAKSVERIVLVDGPFLAELMIDHEVGVSARTVKIPKIDSDYFDEEST